MGVAVELCWPYQARQKGSVENLVGFVKSSFFKVRRFYDLEDLEQQGRDWEREVNEQRRCRATGIIPAVRLAEEAPRLRPLKVTARRLGLAHSGLCGSDRNGITRWPLLLHAARGHQHAGDLVLVCAASAHRGRAL